MSEIYLLNGPNLNLLGQRQPDIYGHETLDDVVRMCEEAAGSEHSIRALQSNFEGQLIDWVHEARGRAAAIIINPGAYAHTSIALMDALIAYEGLVIEVHVSQIHRREEFRHCSYVGLRADGMIVGLGIAGYVMAVHHVCSIIGS